MKKLIKVIFSLLVFLTSSSVNGFVGLSSSLATPKQANNLIEPISRLSRPLFNAEQNNEDNLPLLPDPEFIISDFFAILVASELMGILDDVNNPDFQGWLAPISGVPETLVELIVRFSFLSVIWFGSSVVTGKVKWSQERRTGTIPGALQAGVVFCLGRVAFEVALHGQDPNLGLVLRDGYMVTLAATAFRFLYGQYFLLR